MEIEIIDEVLNDVPLLFLNDVFKNDIDIINNILPYSIGIEIECGQKTTFDLNSFKNIPYIIHVNCTTEEQRFRISNGLQGIICLYLISEQLIANCEFNPLSGIHYHIDMTNTFNKLTNVNQYDWILDELDSWKFGEQGQTRNVAKNQKCNWVNFRTEFKTCEFRIGDMTFEYNVLLTKILDLCRIIKKLNKQLLKNETEDLKFQKVDKDLIINYCNKYSKFEDVNIDVENLKNLKKSLIAKIPIKEEMKSENINFNEVIKTREIKCY